MIANRMKELREKRSRLAIELSDCDAEIRKLQYTCPHKNVAKDTPYIEDGVDSEGYIQYWKERLVTCLDCGFLYHEQTDHHGEFGDEKESE